MRDIKEIRRMFGYTQEKLAAKCGFSQAAVSQWELGTREIGLDSLKKIHEVTGLSYEWLMEDTK